MQFKTFVTLTAMLLPLGLSAQQKKNGFDARQFVSDHSPGANNSSAGKSTANSSRLIAYSEMLYDPGTNAHVYDDSGTLAWSNGRGGDLKSPTLKYDQLTALESHSGNLENNAKFSQTFDGNNNITELKIQSWNGSMWVDSEKHLFTYDMNNNLLLERDIMWNGSSWDSMYKYTYTYDGNHNQLSQTVQIWLSGWMNYMNYNNTYDLNGNQAVSVLSSWNGTTWDSMTRTVYTYNTGNFALTETEQQWSGNWDNDVRRVNTYDGNNNLLTKAYDIWNGSAWEIDILMTNTIQNNNVMTTTYQNWNGVWNNDSKFIYTYDGNHNRLSEVYQYWSNVWENSDRTDMQYNSYDQVTERKDQTWINNAWDYEHEDSWARYYYEVYTSDVKDVFANGDVKVYPVPAYNYVNVEMDLTGARSLNISILDMNGRLVRSYADKASGAYKRAIDVGQLADGNYLLKISGDGGKVSYGRFSVIR